MSKYPTELSAGQLRELSHIADETVAKDLAETEEEIERLKKCQEAYDLLQRHSLSFPERELSAVKYTAIPHEIARREDFCRFMRLIQTARAAETN